jgi:hypothetical protein
MAQHEITTMEIDASHATYKQCSGAAKATARCIVKLSQMKNDVADQRPIHPDHVELLLKSMDDVGVLKGDVVHGTIDVHDPLWGNRSEEEAVKLIKNINAQMVLKGDGKVIMGVLPDGIPVRMLNGQHRFHALCRWIVARWDALPNLRPPLDPPPQDCPWAEGLSKSPAEILAQDEACWVLSLEYTRKLFLIYSTTVSSSVASESGPSRRSQGSKCVLERSKPCPDKHGKLFNSLCGFIVVGR